LAKDGPIKSAMTNRKIVIPGLTRDPLKKAGARVFAIVQMEPRLKAGVTIFTDAPVADLSGLTE
jgi:hypothetical protein